MRIDSEHVLEIRTVNDKNISVGVAKLDIQNNEIVLGDMVSTVKLPNYLKSRLPILETINDGDPQLRIEVIQSRANPSVYNVKTNRYKEPMLYYCPDKSKGLFEPVKYLKEVNVITEVVPKKKKEVKESRELQRITLEEVGNAVNEVILRCHNIETNSKEAFLDIQRSLHRIEEEQKKQAQSLKRVRILLGMIGLVAGTTLLYLALGV